MEQLFQVSEVISDSLRMSTNNNYVYCAQQLYLEPLQQLLIQFLPSVGGLEEV